MKRSRFLFILPLLFSLNCCDFFLPPLTAPNTASEVTEEDTQQQVEREDVGVTVNLGDYHVGDRFNYWMKGQHLTLKDISVDSSDKTCLEYKVLNNGKEVITITPVDRYFSAILKPHGYFEIKSENDYLTISICNAYIDAVLEGNRYKYTVGTIPLVIGPVYVPTPILTEEGESWMEVFVRYNLDGEYYTAKFSTPHFLVKQKSLYASRSFNNGGEQGKEMAGFLDADFLNKFYLSEPFKRIHGRRSYSLECNCSSERNNS